jgi:hypothetical protein
LRRRRLGNRRADITQFGADQDLCPLLDKRQNILG